MGNSNQENITHFLNVTLKSVVNDSSISLNLHIIPKLKHEIVLKNDFLVKSSTCIDHKTGKCSVLGTLFDKQKSSEVLFNIENTRMVNDDMDPAIKLINDLKTII